MQSFAGTAGNVRALHEPHEAVRSSIHFWLLAHAFPTHSSYRQDVSWKIMYWAARS